MIKTRNIISKKLVLTALVFSFVLIHSHPAGAQSPKRPEVDNAQPGQGKGGCFQMGDTFGDGSADEKPVHEVCVSDFSIDKYEVTQVSFQKVMGKNPSYNEFNVKECPYCPVNMVTWLEANEYCGKVGKRLPTEAEWEYAARSGGKKQKFSGTNTEEDLGAYGWYHGNSQIKAWPVGEKKPNELGLYDMSGNVREWVSDWYGYDYYKSSPKDNPKGPSSGVQRVLRGGSWHTPAAAVRASKRGGALPDNDHAVNGFRCAQ
mgnify:FL=1